MVHPDKIKDQILSVLVLQESKNIKFTLSFGTSQVKTGEF